MGKIRPPHPSRPGMSKRRRRSTLSPKGARAEIQTTSPLPGSESDRGFDSKA